MDETAVCENIATKYGPRQSVDGYAGTNRYGVFGSSYADPMHGILDVRTCSRIVRQALNEDMRGRNACGFLFNGCGDNDSEALGFYNFGKYLRGRKEWQGRKLVC
jgi:hypothetical protein